MLERLDVVWPEASEFAKAFELLSSHRLSGGLGIGDCLIAAMALSRSAPIYTFNLKHYRLIKNLDIQEPYKRP